MDSDPDRDHLGCSLTKRLPRRLNTLKPVVRVYECPQRSESTSEDQMSEQYSTYPVVAADVVWAVLAANEYNERLYGRSAGLR